METAYGSRRRQRSRQYAAGVDTARRIRAAAVTLFAARGFAGTTTRELADAAEIWPSVLYHYVGTKEELLEDLLVNGTRLLLDLAERTVQPLDTAARKLAALVTVHVMVQVLEQDLARVIDQEAKSLGAGRRERVLDLRDRYEEIWKQIIRQGMSEGVFDPVDAHLTRLALLEMCNGVTHWYVEGGRLSLEQVAERHADLALDMVGANRGGQRLRSSELHLPPAAELRASVETALAARHSSETDRSEPGT